MKDTVWSAPEVASFSGHYTDNSIAFTADGQELYFRSKRPMIRGVSQDRKGDFWKVRRIGNSWSKPENVGGPINTLKNELSLSIASNGSIYFAASYENKHGGDLYISRLEQGKYLKPVKLPGNICTEFGEGRPFIAPDESFLLFQSNRPGTYGQNDIYVSFKNRDGSWTDPVNLGEKINTKFSEFAPYVTPDGRYLFFSSYKPLPQDVFKGKSYTELLNLYKHPQNGYATLYWVDARIIQKLRPDV